MKKSLIALAALASAGAACAQSSVTLFGIVDATVSHGTGSVSSRTQLTNSGNSSSRLGFRGTEDLGGGMSASFWLEAGVANDDGQGAATNSNNQASGAGAAVAGRQGLTFNRRSTVSLGSSLGELRLGRDYTPQFWNMNQFDPFTTLGVGTNQMNNSSLGGPVNTRASNAIGYFLPANLGGVYGQFQHYRGENASNAPGGTATDGNGTAARVGYASGPLNVAVALSSTRYATGDIKTSNIGAQWNFGVARLMGVYGRDSVSGGATGRGGLVGTVVPVGPGEIKLAYSTYRNDLAGNPRTNKVAVGYVHNLSKRTAAYATYARVKNSGGAVQALGGSVTGANQSSTGYDLGLRHSF
jgi:predicted porin